MIADIIDITPAFEYDKYMDAACPIHIQTSERGGHLDDTPVVVGRRMDLYCNYSVYKIVEHKVDRIIERIVLSRDPLSKQLSITDDQIIHPITTKVVNLTTGVVNLYRHAHSIMAAIDREYATLHSVHDLTFHAIMQRVDLIHTTLTKPQMQRIDEYSRSQSVRLRTLVSGNEQRNLSRITNLDIILGDIILMMTDSQEDTDQYIEDLGVMAGAPSLAVDDNLSRLFSQCEYVAAADLAPHISGLIKCGEYSRLIGQVPSLDIGKYPELEIPMDARLTLMLLLNSIEMSRYSNLDVAFNLETQSRVVHSSYSMYQHLPSISEETNIPIRFTTGGYAPKDLRWLHELEHATYVLIRQLGYHGVLGNVTVRIAKSPTEDILITVVDNNTLAGNEFYFNLAFMGLHTFGLVDSDVTNYYMSANRVFGVPQEYNIH